MAAPAQALKDVKVDIRNDTSRGLRIGEARDWPVKGYFYLPPHSSRVFTRDTWHLVFSTDNCGSASFGNPLAGHPYAVAGNRVAGEGWVGPPNAQIVGFKEHERYTFAFPGFLYYIARDYDSADYKNFIWTILRCEREKAPGKPRR